MNQPLPKRVLDDVGQRFYMDGHLFSSSKSLPKKEYLVKDVRWGISTIVKVNKKAPSGRSRHPTVEFLVISADMKTPRWTKPFAVEEITL